LKDFLSIIETFYAINYTEPLQWRGRSCFRIRLLSVSWFQVLGYTVQFVIHTHNNACV